MNKHPHIVSREINIMLLIVIYLLVSTSLFGADLAGRYLISGIGKDSCHSYVDADEVGRSYYLTWLSGFITSHNFHSENTYSIVNKKSIEDLESWLRGYCYANLDRKFEEAAKNLLRSLEYFKKKNYYD